MTTDQKDQTSPGTDRELKRLLRELEACGHQVNELLQRAGLPALAQRSLFTLLGYVSRAEGRITEGDIQFAEGLMRAQAFSQRKRLAAIAAFQQGKELKAPPKGLGRRLRWFSRLWPGPRLKVALVLCHACQTSGNISAKRLKRCEEAMLFLGLPPDLPHEVMSSYRERTHGGRPGRPAGISYDQACRILGASPQDAYPILKKAYRRSIRQYHPDRLDPDLTPAARAAAKEQMLQLQAAWQRIRTRHQAR